MPCFKVCSEVVMMCLPSVGTVVRLKSQATNLYARGQEQTLQCAIIDKSIVWYGNINFFGYNSETNNVMRITDHKIANEMIGILYSDMGNDENGG